MKKQLHATARIFQSEGNVSMDPSGKIIVRIGNHSREGMREKKGGKGTSEN